MLKKNQLQKGVEDHHELPPIMIIYAFSYLLWFLQEESFDQMVQSANKIADDNIMKMSFVKNLQNLEERSNNKYE